jgi:cytochrome c
VEMLGQGGAEGILTRHPAMPEFRFQPHELVAIVRYLRSIQSRRDVRWAPGS